jgi:hypothetical protein
MLQVVVTRDCGPRGATAEVPGCDPPQRVAWLNDVVHALPSAATVGQQGGKVNMDTRGAACVAAIIDGVSGESAPPAVPQSCSRFGGVTTLHETAAQAVRQRARLPVHFRHVLERRRLWAGTTQ